MEVNKKGFTLIELLAVIVILAVIALIATPVILQIITKARKSASVDSLYGVMAAAKSTYMETLLDTKQMELPAYIECNGTDCQIYHATPKPDATNPTTYEKGDAQTAATTVKFSGSIPTGDLIIDKEGKIVPTAENTFIKVNGFDCSIKANDTVECK